MISPLPKLTSHWKATDPNSGKVYYANLVTKETSWTFPAELGAGGADAPKKEDIWVERQDPKSGRSYYYNQATKERTWNRPAAATVVANDEENKKTEVDDPAAWLERQDPASGRTYYYHKVTKERRWHKPGQEPAAAAGATAAKPAVVTKAATEDDDGPKVEKIEYEPPEPVARTQRHMSIQLGASARTVANQVAEEKADLDGGKALEAAPSGDRFAKLRALAKDKGLAATSLAPVVDENSPEPDQQKRDDDDLDLEKLANELAVGVTFHSMEDYVRDNFNLQRKGMFGKQTTVNKILNWKEELIKKPLHKMPDRAMEAESVQAFKNIVSYMGQRNSSKDDIGHATKLLANSVQAPEVFRDEIFCQIIKQTRGNPDAESSVKGWQLMSIVAGTFPPSKKLEKYLLSYCDENTKESLNDGTRVHAGVKPYAKYAMMRIKKSTSLGPRKEVPTAMEIQAAKDRQPVVIRVHLLNGHYKTIPAECWTTIRELNGMVAKKLNISDPAPFSTFEVSSNDEERVLEEDDRVLDLLSYWQREFGAVKKGKAAPTFQFVYKLRLFFDIADTDTAAIDLAYIQAAHDVTDSRYPCNEEDCLTLAALQAQEQFGDYNGTRDRKAHV